MLHTQSYILVYKLHIYIQHTYLQLHISYILVSGKMWVFEGLPLSGSTGFQLVEVTAAWKEQLAAKILPIQTNPPEKQKKEQGNEI